MANPSRAKGTRYENALLEDLRVIWPDAERAPLKGVNDRGDYVGVPFPIEAKNTARPRVSEWCHRLRTIAGTPGPPSRLEPWVLFWKGGDARRKKWPGELAVMPADFALYLLANAKECGAI